MGSNMFQLEVQGERNKSKKHQSSILISQPLHSHRTNCCIVNDHIWCRAHPKDLHGVSPQGRTAAWIDDEGEAAIFELYTLLQKEFLNGTQKNPDDGETSWKYRLHGVSRHSTWYKLGTTLQITYTNMTGINDLKGATIDNTSGKCSRVDCPQQTSEKTVGFRSWNIH